MNFDGPSEGFTDLIIADLGGVNPFQLSLCATPGCANPDLIFGGFGNSAPSPLAPQIHALPSFATTDGVAGAMDQVWLFRFDETITQSVQIRENDDRLVYTGDRMQVDYFGAVPASSLTPIPVPASLPLMASGIVLLGWAMRRKTQPTHSA